MEAPSQEDRLADVMQVRQPAPVEGHTLVVKDGRIVLSEHRYADQGVGKRTRGSAPLGEF